MNIYQKNNPPVGYYVYAYIRSRDSNTAKAGTPYYIGKGKKRRAWSNDHTIALPLDQYIVILEANLSEIGAYALERRLIRWFGKVIDKSGILYNVCDGGEGGQLGYCAANDAITNKSIGIVSVSDARWDSGEIVHPITGITRSDETREKIKQNHADFTGELNPFYNKKHTFESKQRIGSRDYSSITGGNHKKAKQVKINGVIYNSIKDASRTLCINDNTLRDYLKHRRLLTTEIWEAFYII